MEMVSFFLSALLVLDFSLESSALIFNMQYILPVLCTQSILHITDVFLKSEYLQNYQQCCTQLY
jgi:hypothetical protein